VEGKPCSQKLHVPEINGDDRGNKDQGENLIAMVIAGAKTILSI
jgi:hypothetical protein